MSEVSHARYLPWGKVFQGGKGKGHEIPYELALSSPPMIEKMPSISDDEYQRRKDAFAEIEQHTD